MKETFKRSTIVVIMAGVILMANTLCWAEFQVNTYTADWQWMPAVAMDPTGNFVVVWESYGQRENGQDGDYGGIYAQRFDSGGTALGSEFRINVTTARNQKRPDIGMDPSGNFVVTWASTVADDEEIYARRYNSSGVPLTGEFLVNTYTTKRQLDPSVGMNDSGAFVITWQSNYGLGGDHEPVENYISGRKYNSSGVPLGQEFVISQEIQGNNPDVAMDDSGEFTVAYLRTASGGYYLRMRRYNADGSPKGSAVQLTDDLGAMYHPSIAMDGSGDFVITWGSHPSDYRQSDSYAQRFDSSGSPVGDEFMVNTTVDNSQGSATVTMNDSGQSLITWRSGDYDTGDFDIFGRGYDSDGTPIGGEFIINNYTDGAQSYAEIAMNNDGRYVVVWASDGQDGDGWGVFAEIGNIFPLPGDVDGDGWVGEDDLSIVIDNWGKSLGREFGDLNGDGTVSGLDYTEVITYWGTGVPPEPPSGIPEPATLSLLLIGGLALLSQRR